MSQPLAVPVLVLLDPAPPGEAPRVVPLDRSPFTIGRKDDQDLVLAYSSVSRRHARILHEQMQWTLIDEGSRAGTFVNDVRIDRHQLRHDDLIRIGSSNQGRMRFRSEDAGEEVTLRSLLGQMPREREGEISLGRLSWFVDAARKLNDLGAVSEILSALVETTLSLTGAERGFVFLCEASGALRLAAGRDSHGAPLNDEATVSNSAIRASFESGSEFIVTDTLAAEAAKPSHSILAQNLRAILCIPLRKPAAERRTDDDMLGVLYLDSRKERDMLTGIDRNLLHLVATEAATLVQNAKLAQAEEEGRRYREELKIASAIQQGLMRVQIPELSFAKVEAQSIPCKGIGGDFFDVIAMPDAVYLVVTDVSGKGVSAAILGSTLQGLIYAQLLASQSLAQIAKFANEFLCRKDIGKYATLVMLRITPAGQVDYINCGHVQPLLHSGGAVGNLQNCNLPVGLIASATYATDSFVMHSGERILIATDGVTEAPAPGGDSYGDKRLHDLILHGANVSGILADIQRFSDGAPLDDDCTLLEVCYEAKFSAGISSDVV